VPLAGAMVELRNMEGAVVAFKVSSYDGFFVFTDVPYTTYSLNLAGERRNQANQPKVSLNRDRGLHSNIDLVVTPSKPETPAEPTIVPQSAIPAPVAATPAVAAPAVTAPVIATPAVTAPAAAAAKPVSPAAVRPAVRKPADGRKVQLGVFSKLEGAQLHRQKLLALDLMKAEQIEIVPVNMGARGLLHRVVATPVETTADALCAALKTRGAECFIIAP